MAGVYFTAKAVKVIHDAIYLLLPCAAWCVCAGIYQWSVRKTFVPQTPGWAWTLLHDIRAMTHEILRKKCLVSLHGNEPSHHVHVAYRGKHITGIKRILKQMSADTYHRRPFTEYTGCIEWKWWLRTDVCVGMVSFSVMVGFYPVVRYRPAILYHGAPICLSGAEAITVPTSNGKHWNDAGRQRQALCTVAEAEPVRRSLVTVKMISPSRMMISWRRKLRLWWI